MKIKEKFIISNNSNVYFISDLHYGHRNSISYGNRPFNDVSEMNNFIISELKNKVRENDIIFDLGDLFWKVDYNEIKNVISSIPCNNIYKIIGNHDSYNLYYKDSQISNLFKGIFDLLDITVSFGGKDYLLTLCHYPLVSWNHKTYGSLMIHGHCHGNIDEFNDSMYDLRLDVGFDSSISKDLGTFIISFENILNFFNKKTGGKSFNDWIKINQSEGRL